MANFGKPLLLLILFATTLFASVRATVDRTSVTVGDRVTLTLQADSSDAVFPDLNQIGGAPVLHTGTSTQTQIINGRMSVANSKSYVFIPGKSMTIPAYPVRVDGKEEQTRPIRISVGRRAQTTDKPFRFDLRPSATEVYVGEQIDLTAAFEIRKGLRLNALEFSPDNLDHFWSLPVDENWQGTDMGNKALYQRRFLLFPQKPGTLTVEPQPVTASLLDNDRFAFFSSARQERAYSNGFTVTVKPLPDGVTLIGDFKITATLDKQETEAGEPVNLTVRVEGTGNIDDLKLPPMEIPGTTLFSDEGEVKRNLENGIYGGSKEIKYAILGQGDFTVPALELKFFDKASKTVKTAKTFPLEVTVTGGAKAAAPVVRTAETAQPRATETTAVTAAPMGWMEKGIYYAAGLLTGLLLFLFRNLELPKRNEKTDLTVEQRFKAAKDAKGLLRLLMPYMDDPEIREVARELEEGKVNRKKVRELLKQKKHS